MTKRISVRLDGFPIGCMTCGGKRYMVDMCDVEYDINGHISRVSIDAIELRRKRKARRAGMKRS